jgi:hypothetical protein
MMKVAFIVLSLIGITGVYLRHVKQAAVLELIGYLLLAAPGARASGGRASLSRRRICHFRGRVTTERGTRGPSVTG